VHCDKKLYLVFEYLALDLKKYMDSVSVTGLPMPLVRVRLSVVGVMSST